MSETSFRQMLDQENALRVRFEMDQGVIVKFVTQLECLIDMKWTAVIRYDTAHDFAHCDKLHPYKATEKMVLRTQDYNEALTYAMDDLQDNWQRYRRRYEKWIK